jgi:hypothetical protein
MNVLEIYNKLYAEFEIDILTCMSIEDIVDFSNINIDY